MSSQSDYGAEFGLAPASNVHDGQVKHDDIAVVWFDSVAQAEDALDKYTTREPDDRLVVVRRAWTVVEGAR